MPANFSSFLMCNCLSKSKGKWLSHEPETHENRSEGREMRCYRSRASSSGGDSESPAQIVFVIFIFFNCVLGLSELFSSLLDKNCWMCSNTASRYSCPFIATDSAARLMGSLTWFRNKKDAVQRLTPSAACFGADKEMGIRWRNISCCCRDSYQRHHYPDHGVRVLGLSLSHQAVRTV